MTMGLKEKRILITGASGFIGANLTRYLTDQGIKPYISIREGSDTWRINDILSKTNVHYLDITDKKNVIETVKSVRPQIIFHTAAHGGYVFQQEADKIIDSNFLGTVSLLNACNEIGYDLFINTGSSSEYGIKQKPMKESDVLAPFTDYAVSKAASTLYCQSLAKRESLPIVTLRIFSVYGYYEEVTRLIASTIISCIRKENPKCSSPTPVRDFFFIEDLINAYIKTTENIKSIKGEIINIGSGRQSSVGEAVSLIVKLTDNKLRPEWGKINNPRFEPKKWQADISKAKKLLGWRPNFDLEQGLKKTIEWYRRNMV